MADKRDRSSNDPHHYQPPHLSRQHGKHRHVSKNTITRSTLAVEQPKKAVA